MGSVDGRWHKERALVHSSIQFFFTLYLECTIYTIKINTTVYDYLTFILLLIKFGYNQSLLFIYCFWILNHNNSLLNLVVIKGSK